MARRCFFTKRVLEKAAMGSDSASDPDGLL